MIMITDSNIEFCMPSEWKIVSDVNVFQPLDKGIQELYLEEYPTIFMTIPVILIWERRAVCCEQRI